MSKSVYLYSETLSAEALRTLAERYHTAYGLPAEVRLSSPQVTPPADWATLLDHEDPTVLRYWSAQTRQLGTMLAEAFPPLADSAVQDSVLTVLGKSWDDDAAGSVVYRRELPDHGLAIIFQGLAVDSSGRLRCEGAAMPLPPLDAVAPMDEGPEQSEAANHVKESIWIILKYIGAGLSAAEPPILGTIFSVLLDFIQEFSKTSSNKMAELLGDIKKLLQEDRIQIEMDTANAVVLTWAQYEGAHFQEADLKILNQDHADPTAPGYKAAAERVSEFVRKINADLNGTPRLFDAVNLMRGATDPNPETLDFPTDAMLKFSYFMLYAGFILALGKQAWLASKALNGNDAEVTKSLQKEVAFLSTDYITYVNQLSSAIRAQLSTRTGRWVIQNEMKINGNTFYSIHDNARERGSRYYPPKEWGYTGDTVWHYCGDAQAATAWQQANEALANLVKTYQNYMYRRIVKTASDGRTLQQEFDARISTFQENDKKYQKLAAIL